ncbi:LPS export ABC transporter permease LptG [Sedimenticola selenatireducens]|uniref:LPS export ABC transporter permease LptG n=1 Tax=Sedimenticola selenatireducens TaxID=191960 RepID=A0A558DX12_9GAMM|nr:LPS export ABC transporter permease LptG [Sedimenticola selenatireducens]TVO75553.1 LPS export ABC transporter permease LptG [Sedimenticola selenatireducens]TVT65459.1 MAG: LPS export ABC transporter permease LptG [Sedimenticola selenatireducens]
MRVLDRYIGVSVIVSILITLLILVVLVGFVTLMDELGAAGTGDYTTSDVFYYVLLILPRRAYEVFPMAVLLGSLVGLGSLASNSELIAMRAAGVSLARIIGSVLKAGMLAMLVVVVIGEAIAPNTEQYAERMRASKMSQQITLKSKYGFWARDGGSFVNIRQILPGSQLKDIYIYEFSEERELLVSTYAEFAQYADEHWLLRGIQQTRFLKNGVESRQLDEATWESLLNPNILNVVVVRPTMLPVWGLYQYIDFMHENGQEATIYEVAFWGKVIMPLVTLVMVFLAVPFVFGVLRSVGIGQRIFAGSLLGLAFFLLNKVLGHMAVVYSLNPLFAAAVPGLLFLGLGFWFVRRIH